MSKPQSAQILIVEDEKPIRRFLTASLSKQGYRLIEAETGGEGLDVIASQTVDLIVLDLGLPDINGLSIIDKVRETSQLPIIVLSAWDRERDKVDALDRGADDYLTKPFGIDELLARVRVALRHFSRIVDARTGATTRFVYRELTVDMEARRVFVRDEEVRLTALEYRLLVSLVQHAGKVMTHRYLLREVWGPGHADEPQLLRVHMANLRRKLEQDTTEPEYILTEQGVGYRLCCDDSHSTDTAL